MPSLAKLTTALLVMSATACVSEDARPAPDNSLDWRSGGKGDGQTCDFDQQSGTTYLNNFLYQEVPSQNGLHYRVAFTFEQRATLANGDQADFTMYLLPEGRAIVDYQELHRVDATESDVVNETKIVTRYSVDSSTRAVTIPGVGTGVPKTATGNNGGCAPAYDFTYAVDLRSPGLRGGKTIAYAGTSSAYVIDPDHLDQVPSETARRWFQEDVASGKIVVIRN